MILRRLHRFQQTAKLFEDSENSLEFKRFLWDFNDFKNSEIFERFRRFHRFLKDFLDFTDL